MNRKIEYWTVQKLLKQEYPTVDVYHENSLLNINRNKFVNKRRNKKWNIQSINMLKN